MSNFEKKFGKYAIKNISLMLIMCYAVGYLIQMVNPAFLLYLTLNPYQILHGQIWRIFTAGFFQLVFYFYFPLFLLFDWDFFRADMGDIPL